MMHPQKDRSGFTLVELLIVVIILGVIAAVAIPQFTSSTEDAKLSALDITLSEMRGAVEMYYHQHGAVYPGEKKSADGTAVTTAGEAATSFVDQLTKYSSITGKTSNTKDTTYKYGPYIKKGMPLNPYNSLNTITCDITTTDITTVSSGGSSGWKFYIKTGRLLADDGSHDSN